MTRPNDTYESAAWNKADALGIHPLLDPIGDGHHTDMKPTAEDLALGNAIAWYLGDLMMGAIEKSFLHPAMPNSPVDQWTRVARALRIHGLRICDREEIK